MISNLVVALVCVLVTANACSDFYMNFTNYKISARTLDLGSDKNWTVSVWPKGLISGENLDQKLAFWPAKIGTVGFTGNWFGDDKWHAPSFFADSLNEKGLSCSMLTLINSKYEEKSETKTNIFNALFCHYVTQTYDNVLDLKDALSNIAIWGPAALNQHYAIRDSTGNSLVIEMIDGSQHVYLDTNDGKTGFGIMTNEPSFDWHLQNAKHYEWKRTLARQAIPIPGNFYPDERFMRVHMVKSGMQTAGLFETTNNYQNAIALTAQVLNVISVPMGEQYGTDSGETSGEGDADHSVYGVIRDHANPTLFWRDNHNPTFRRIQLKDLDFSVRGSKVKSVALEQGAYFVDVSADLQ